MMTVFGSGTMLGGPVAGYLTDHYGWQLSFIVQVRRSRTVDDLLTHSSQSSYSVSSSQHFTYPKLLFPPRTRVYLPASLPLTGSDLCYSSGAFRLSSSAFHSIPHTLSRGPSPVVWGLLVASAVTAGLFLLVENRVERPVMSLDLLKDRHIAAVMLGGFTMSVANQAFVSRQDEASQHPLIDQMFFVPMYFNIVVGTSTAQSGYILSVCSGLGLAIGSVWAGR